MRRDQSNFAVGNFLGQRFFDRFQAVPANFRTGELDLLVAFLRKPFQLKRMRFSGDKFRDIYENGLSLNLAPGGDRGEIKAAGQQGKRFPLGRGERGRLRFLSIDRRRRVGSKLLDD